MAFKLSEQIIHLLTVVSLSAGSPAFKMHDQYAIETDNWSLYSSDGRLGESCLPTLTASRFLRHAAAQQQYSSLTSHPVIRHTAQFRLNNGERP